VKNDEVERIAQALAACSKGDSRWKTKNRGVNDAKFNRCKLITRFAWTAMTAPAPALEPESVAAAAFRVIRDPWRTFVLDWNWKAAVLSALFRTIFFSIATFRGPGAARGIVIEILFRLAIGGFWGSLLQAFRAAQPAWLAGSCAAVILPASAHTLEFLALAAGNATHIKAGMIVSVVVSVFSLLLNWCLMRDGLMITGAGALRLSDDFRRLPGSLYRIFGGRQA
jgi:hypothetical protein